VEPIDPNKNSDTKSSVDKDVSVEAIAAKAKGAEAPNAGPFAGGPAPKPTPGSESQTAKAPAGASANDTASGKDKSVPPGTKPSRSAGRPGRGLAVLALAVGLVALGLHAWQWQQDRQQSVARASDFNQQMGQLADSQRRNQQSVQGRLEGLPDANEWQQIEGLTADLQRSQRALSQELDVLRGDARADWKLAEAEYLLRLASLRLLAAQDVKSARELLNAVDNILRDQPDSGVFSVREELARVQAELEALPEIDRSGVYLRLAALHEQVNRLVLLPVPEFDPDEVSVEEEYEDRLARRTRAERVLMRLERYVRVDFQRGKVITPLLDEAEMQRVRRTLQLTMEQAQWAALRGESDIYLASLSQADGILRQFFELENPQVKAMQAQLSSLAERQVDLEPPALAALQQDLAAYIQSRRNPADNGGAGNE
jgi:uroporphyrin-3 C-methyltransferase